MITFHDLILIALAQKVSNKMLICNAHYV